MINRKGLYNNFSSFNTGSITTSCVTIYMTNATSKFYMVAV